MIYLKNEVECKREDFAKLLSKEQLDECEKIATRLFENGCYEYQIWLDSNILSFLPRQKCYNIKEVM